MSAVDDAPVNPILNYIQQLTETKKGLPFHQPVAVLTSHTVTDSATLFRLVSEIGPHIAVLQVQADVIDDWSDEVIDQLTYSAKKYGFILWEGSRILNSTVNLMGRGRANLATRKTIADLAKGRYVNGAAKTATWANLATSWASGVALDQQEQDVLLPTLRKAAREAVATTAKTIETEISVADGAEPVEQEQTPTSPPTQNGWHEFSADMGYALRKSSTISVTESVTLQPHVEPEDGVPAPPLLSRAMALCLPCDVDTAFTLEFRQGTIAAACANQDFVAGLLTSEPLFCEYHGNNLIDLAVPEGCDVSDEMEHNLLAYSPYLERNHSVGLFSLVPPELAYAFESDPIHTLNADSTSPGGQPRSVAKLEYMVGKALKMRDANRKENEGNQVPKDLPKGPSVLQCPMVILP
ncbi:hypothetical protein N7532_007968 [Penicillium argentinense]|uniref:Orotidine 5'-phosphate decarboxylase n=1 Tax=Penicillium argentinense TaxID=1131581 RepID=A0A9W9EWM0_9EURO|nr:uncharacterized protein N7532_007968 [Penicillium argentinense]KAJ5089284.1 hypothetical protein N7532_007968 [Penicillium argentinense]